VAKERGIVRDSGNMFKPKVSRMPPRPSLAALPIQVYDRIDKFLAVLCRLVRNTVQITLRATWAGARADLVCVNVLIYFY
jgi:hypothetical protein